MVLAGKLTLLAGQVVGNPPSPPRIFIAVVLGD